MKQFFNSFITLLAIVTLYGCGSVKETKIPLPEHPRPDFHRAEFINLNGYWHFTFDKDRAHASLLSQNFSAFDQKILVPFPWGSKLSEVEDKGDIAWYGRQINIPNSWEGKRIFLVVGASDWETTAWIDGKELGSHQGGYTPFEFELTNNVIFGKDQTLCFKVDDTSSEAHLYGKQGYGNARGLWQTVYLEARGQKFIDKIYFTPNIADGKVQVKVDLDTVPDEGTEFILKFKNGEREDVKTSFGGNNSLVFDVSLPNQHLWDIDDPYLYEVSACVLKDGVETDIVNTYFGQREIGTITMPDGYKYVSLNGKPIYLQLCLDQSYHPDGFYTFPSDEFMKNEIMLSKKLGLNGNRIHIKVEVPRKLYWADKLGLLIMSDVPNFWGEPIPEARADWEACMRSQVARDFNHPSIFAWVNFNETWGLFSKEGEKNVYKPETQEWVRNMYLLTKSLDPTRLVEDNSACNYDHVQTDINSWHQYLPAYEWEEYVSKFDSNTFPGGTYNYIGDNKIGDVPMINSECGNVWGYTGSAGDGDFTWDYHEMMNTFHRHPKVAGWLYTEHHDVINEWNGYVKYDRTPKIDGLDELVPGMSIKDFHTPYYVTPMEKNCREAHAGSTQTVTLMSSFTTDKDPGKISLETELVGWNTFGEQNSFGTKNMDVVFKPFCLAKIADMQVNIPEYNGVYVYRYVLKNSTGDVLSRNFSMFIVKDGKSVPTDDVQVITFDPASFTDSEWSQGSKSILGGLKVNGYGKGYFEYSVAIPENVTLNGLKSVKLLFEASAKQLFGKDIEDGFVIEDDFMLGHGTFDPCKSENSYSMTDTYPWKSTVKVSVNGVEVGTINLNDDPADHRGILSWYSQLENRHLSEAGSYGYLAKVEIPIDVFQSKAPLTIRFTVPELDQRCFGGLAIYGKEFGRYPLNPTLVISK